MKSFTLLLVCLLIITNGLWAKALQEDSAVIKGQLANGLSYYIRSNAYPKDRASFYFVQKTGAALEEDHENGLAHFLEHMAFNGTEHFEGNTLISTLENYGVKFGENLNAYTGFDETVYKISNAPTDQEGAVDTCLLVLKDWSSGILLDKKEIEKERGVIMEEWRSRQNAATRTQKQFFPVLTTGSIYAQRDIIGDTAIIKGFKRKTLKSYHQKWYRPEFQAIVVVGDFVAEDMEKQIQQLFSDIPTSRHKEPRLYATIPDNEEPLFTIATDPEQLGINFLLIEKQKDSLANIKGSEEYYKHQKVIQVYNHIVKERFQRAVQQSNPPYITASSRLDGFIAKDSKAYTINAVLNPKEIKQGVRAALEENYKIKTYGFYESEVERAKESIIKSLDNNYKNRDKRTHDSFANQMKANFLNQTPILDINDHLELSKEIISSITLEETNKIAPELSGKNQVLVFTAPEAYRDSLLNKKELMDLMDSISVSELVNVEESTVPTELINYSLSHDGKITKTADNEALGATEWRLPNGAKVIYKHCDKNKNKLQFKAFSHGGLSLVDLEDLPSAALANATSAFGVADYDPVTLKQILTGKSVTVNTMINDASENMMGACNIDDFEEMLQLIYLRFEQPRFDSIQYNSILDRVKMQLTFKQNSPEMAIMDSMMQIMSNYSERTPLINDEYIKKIELEKIKKVYGDRFASASNFTFIFIGNIEEEVAIPLIEKYIGAIRHQERDEKSIDHNDELPLGQTEKRIAVEMKEPKGISCIAFQKDVKYSYKTKLYSDLVSQLLKMRYLKSIREEESGTYGVNLKIEVSQYPREQMNCIVSFSCLPTRVDSLKTFVYKEMDDLMQNGPTVEELAKVVKIFKKKRGEQKQTLNFWKNALYQYYYNGVNIDSQEDFYNTLEEVSPDELKNAMNMLFENANTMDLIFEPKPND